MADVSDGEVVWQTDSDLDIDDDICTDEWRVHTPRETWDSVIEMLRKRLNMDARPVPTYIDSLDRLLGGGLPLGGTTVLTCYPGGGKSSLALSIALQAARAGRSTLFWSLELPLEDAHCRLVCLEAELPWGELRMGQHLETTIQVASRLSDLPLTLLDGGLLPVPRVPEAITATGAELVVVDYAQLLADPAGGFDARQASEAAAKMLLNIAKQHTCAFLVLCSASRSAYQRKGKHPEDFRGMAKESGRWESDACVELAIVPEPGEQRHPRDKRGWIYIAKNRVGGSTGRVAVRFDGLSGWWQEVSEAREPQGTVSDDVIQHQVLEAIRTTRLTSVRQITDRVQGRVARVRDLVKDMLRSGRIAKGEDGVFEVMVLPGR